MGRSLTAYERAVLVLLNRAPDTKLAAYDTGVLAACDDSYVGAQAVLRSLRRRGLAVAEGRGVHARFSARRA